MNFITYNKDTLGDSSKFSSSDNLLSLLQRPLLLFSGASSSSPPSDICPSQMSFDCPFEDPTMEPLPMRSNGSAIHRSPPDSSKFRRRFHDYKAPRPSKKEMKQGSDYTDLYQDLIDILEPVIDELSGSKRVIEDLVVHHDHGPSAAKRQRVTLSATAQGASSSGEVAVRFRPHQEKQWEEQLQKLIQFKHKHGHCCVPHAYPEDPTLARWVKRQRYQYKKFNDGDHTSTMTECRIQQLESIGFVWNSHAAAWLEKVNELKAFKQRTGHCEVPSHYPENVSLATWVKCQRRQRKRLFSGKPTSMTMERVLELESLGFEFDRQQGLGKRTVS